MSVTQLRNGIKVEGIVTVRKYGEGEYRWTRLPHAGAVGTRSSEVFTDEWRAWLAAASIARVYGHALLAPDEVRARLIEYHRQRMAVAV